MSGGLLVVAGEASADKATANVLVRLQGVHAFGLGGSAMVAAGGEVLQDIRDVGPFGVARVAPGAYAITARGSRLLWEAKRRRPQAALLANATDLNFFLAPRLHALGIRVLWYGAPVFEAASDGLKTRLRRSVDRLAVTLPFEEGAWRNLGLDAHYVGHPSREVTLLDRDVARRALGLTPFASAVGILPGSRPEEIRRLLEPMLAAYEPVCFDLASLDGRVLLAPSLDKKTHDWAKDCARAHGVPVVDVEPGGSAMSVLSAFDVTLTSPGSAALESALAGAVPIMVHRGTFPADLKDLAPRRKKTLGLPNRLLQRDVFPELGPSEANATRIGDTLVRVLRAKHRYAADCVAVDRSLGSKKQPSEAVAAMLLPWLGANAALRAS